ncbi:MAG: copper resistance protein CopC, partial [Ktedonobacteraceae bacterium]|nr:copper resistance protein CopC [Ktedonobacteraceae bacterium]
MLHRQLLIIPITLLLSILAFAGSLALIAPPIAQAHAFVIGSDPVDGSTINKVPSEIRIFFNADISSLSNAHVYSIQDGKLDEVNEKLGSVSPSSSRELDMDVKTPEQQSEGSYEVIWTAVAKADGRTTNGIIGFNVGYSNVGAAGTATLGPTTSNDLDDIRRLDFTNILTVVWEWLVLAALTFWIGILVIEQFVLAKGRDLFPLARKRTVSLQWLCMFTLFFGELVSLILRNTNLAQAQATNHFPLTSLWRIIADTQYGTFWVVRIVLVLCAMGLLYWTERGKKKTLEGENAKTATGNIGTLTSAQLLPNYLISPRKTRQLPETSLVEPLSAQPYMLIWLVLAGLILLTEVLTSSLVQVIPLHVSAILFDWLYLVTQGMWLGGFAYLAYVLLPFLVGAEFEYNPETLVIVLRRLTPILLVGIGAQLVSELFLAEASITDRQQWLGDPYGRTLLVQAVLTTVAVGLSLYALLVLRPKLTRQALPVINAELSGRIKRHKEIDYTTYNLRFIARVLSLLSAGILLCGALLSFFAPPIHFPDVPYTVQSSEPTSATNAQTKQMGNLTVTLQVFPGLTGYTHTIIVSITDSKGRPVTDAKVDLFTSMRLMDMGKTHETISGGTPTYITTFDKKEAFNMSGLWSIDIQVQRPKQQ